MPRLPKRGRDGGTEGPRQGPKSLGWIHASKMIPELSGFLSNEGLAHIGRGDDHRWVGLHPTLAAAYMLALAGACAEQEGLEPVTDNPSPLLSPTQGAGTGMSQKTILVSGASRAVSPGLRVLYRPPGRLVLRS